jgi:hypothetical protein
VTGYRRPGYGVQERADEQAREHHPQRPPATRFICGHIHLPSNVQDEPRAQRVGSGVWLAFLVSKLLTKFLGHKELRNTENEKGHSERGKKPIYTVVSKVVHTEPDEGHAHYH